MADDKSEEQLSSLSNAISDETGNLDVRFVLWRKFCAESGRDVDTLPSELSVEERAEWEQLKETELSTPTQE